jgi:ubiquinone/menaquinone biosynthesis C-methylase UbiE
MSSRGEASFTRLPSLGAKLYDGLSRGEALQDQFREIAQDLVSRIDAGRLLDVGMGPGRLLAEIHRLNPAIELFGLDISDAMVRVAGENLAGTGADLRRGTIQQTDFASNSFDIVTCTGSFYLWNQPEECLEEIHRILKRGCSAYLFETYRDFDQEGFRAALRANLRRENLLRRMLTPRFLKQQLRMTYQTDELAAIIARTRFADSHAIEKLTLAGLPVWLRIELTKGSTA